MAEGPQPGAADPESMCLDDVGISDFGDSYNHHHFADTDNHHHYFERASYQAYSGSGAHCQFEDVSGESGRPIRQEQRS